MPPESHEPEISERSRGVALALGFFGGFFGLHRFYVGKKGTGVAMIVTFGGLGIWWLYDMVLLATGEFRDIDDLPLRRRRRPPWRSRREVRSPKPGSPRSSMTR